MNVIRHVLDQAEHDRHARRDPVIVRRPFSRDIVQLFGRDGSPNRPPVTVLNALRTPRGGVPTSGRPGGQSLCAFA